jgi:hypothetical protein
MERTRTGRGHIRAAAAAVVVAGVMAGLAVAEQPSRRGKPDQNQPQPAQPSPAQPAQPSPAQPTSQPGQPAATQPAPSPSSQRSILDGLLQRGRSRDWTLKVRVHVYAEAETTSRTINIREMQFDTAAIVFPANYGTASSELDQERFKGEVRFDDRVVDDDPVFQEGYPCGTRLARWEMLNKRGREMTLLVEIPVTAWETIFDEKGAERVPWPGQWSPTAETALRPDTFVDAGSAEVKELVDQWLEGNDPKKLKPVTLAKFLAGRVWEHVQVSGNGLEWSNLGFVGVNLQRASLTAKSGRGSEHDMTVLLAAVYRAAGLPARVVIGYDVSAKKEPEKFLKKEKDGPTSIRAWVEFCLYDEGAQKELWVPVDVARMRASSSRVPALQKPWKYFGTHDELENVIPFAFQYHPPTTVVAHGAYAFWGWQTTPKVQQVSQYLAFDAQTTPRRSSDRKRDRR